MTASTIREVMVLVRAKISALFLYPVSVHNSLAKSSVEIPKDGQRQTPITTGAITETNRHQKGLSFRSFHREAYRPLRNIFRSRRRRLIQQPGAEEQGRQEYRTGDKWHPPLADPGRKHQPFTHRFSQTGNRDNWSPGSAPHQFRYPPSFRNPNTGKSPIPCPTAGR